MSKLNRIEECSSIATGPIFDNLEHDLIEKAILKKADNLNRLRMHRRTFRGIMDILKDKVHQIEMDDHIYSLGNVRPTNGRVQESDIKILRKANLAVSELLEMNEKLKRQKRVLIRKLARQGNNNKSQY